MGLEIVFFVIIREIEVFYFKLWGKKKVVLKNVLKFVVLLIGLVVMVNKAF